MLRCRVPCRARGLFTVTYDIFYSRTFSCGRRRVVHRTRARAATTLFS